MQAEISIAIRFVDETLYDEEQEALALALARQIRAARGELGEVERVPTVAPPGSKSLGGHVVGVVVALLSVVNIKAFLAFIYERLANQAIELNVETDGRKIQLKARTQDELRAAIEAAERLVALKV
ncbi:MAG: hypothetical protein KC468_35110 [Myxococcales bacterium]|nr:hypothetical protein [Myxococcales bacterium]